MRSVPLGPAAALLAALLIAVPPAALATGPQGRTSTSVLSSVGTRTDLPLPPVKGPPAFPPAGQRSSSWRALDGKAFEQAKAAADAAAQGSAPSPYKNDFSLTATPSSQTVAQGAGTSYTVTVALTSGRPQTVRFSVSGLPAGATASFNPTSVTGSGSSTLGITTAATSPVGSYSLTIKAKGSNATHTTAVTLVVTGNDFSISAIPTSLSLAQGTQGTSTISTAVTAGVSQSVALSVSGTPSGATATLNPTSVTSGSSSTLTVDAGTAAGGTYTLTITGTGTSATHSTTVSLTVTTPVTNDFSISANPTSLSLAQGTQGTSTISTAVTAGVSQSVALSVSGTPSGATATLNPTSVTSGSSSTLTVDAGTAAGGTYTLTITGTGTSATHSTTVSLTVTTSSTSGPTASPSWGGEYQGGLAPPDPTGAIGPTSYIELINLRYGIYDRGGSLLSTSGSEGDLGALTGLPVSELSDPQILWDPGAQRFYYLVLDVSRYGFAFGYSKTASPQSGADFCKYILDYGYGNTLTLPDYPKLGVTTDYVLIGSNDFLLAALYNGSNVNWLAKPTDPNCPGTIGPGGTFSSLRNADGSLTSTPVPAVNADPSGTGYVVGSVDVSNGPGSVISVFKVTRNASTGAPTMSGPYSVSVPAYSVPADAPQKGVTAVLDTMDTRLTHAVAAFDPNLGATAVWTAHTVFGGAGAEGRWYEINVGGTPSLAQSGKATDPSLYVWNGAISPDRANDGTSGAFGGDMVMGFDTSSSATFPAIQMVSKKGSAAQSPWVLVQQSPGANVDFTCGPTCRWGDYGGATPDPVASAGGQVWLSNEWNLTMTDGSATVWRTWNWGAQP